MILKVSCFQITMCYGEENLHLMVKMHSIGRNAYLIREYLTRNFNILRDTNVSPKTNLAASVDVQMQSGCLRGDLIFFLF